MARKKVELSVILPVFNEGKNISTQIKLIEKSLKPRHEILIIYDFDGDDTVPVVKKLQKNYESIKLVKNRRKGIISAIKTGIGKSAADAVVIMPADLADDPRTVNKMYEKLKGGLDIVCATRYGKGGKKIGGGFLKTQLSRLAGLFAPLLLGIQTTDIANGFKMYKKKVFDKIKIESDGGWEFSTEVMIKANYLGFKIDEVATIWRDRTKGKSKFKLFKWLPRYIRWYIWGIYKRLDINR